jgi:hypothetical protein
LPRCIWKNEITELRRGVAGTSPVPALGIEEPEDLMDDLAQALK